MNEAWVLSKLPLTPAAKLMGVILAMAALLGLIALVFGRHTLFGGFPNGTLVTEIVGVDAPPITLGEALTRIDRGKVTFIYVSPDSYPDGATRWYVELDGSLERRWRVEGRDVQVDGIPILSADGQSVGVTEDEWARLLERVSEHNKIGSIKIKVFDERSWSEEPPVVVP